MSGRIEDYALIGDTQTAALVHKSGSIDWLCLPRFDSGACFAALLGDSRHGRWLLAPSEEVLEVHRRYRPNTLTLETEFRTASGVVRLVDGMPLRGADLDLVRIVEGVRGQVRMQMELIIRFDYGHVLPWVRQLHGALQAVAGPNALYLWSGVKTRGKDFTTVADFTVSEGQRIPFVMVWQPSHLPAPPARDGVQELEEAERWWQGWSSRCSYDGQWKEPVVRSLITLKALTYAPTGGIVAAPTTSLPERIGGVRNWDYRYCWLRDATFTLYALMQNGYREEAEAWRDWLLRAVAGDASQLQIMYGPAGERRLDEAELNWLPGYEGSRPVREGNAAVHQLQLDVYGEVMDALHEARRMKIHPEPASWSLQRSLLEFLESAWGAADEGIWEVRGPRRHFTHSKVMAWVAFDRAIRSVESWGLEGPVERWRKIRDQIHQEVCSHGYDRSRKTFIQAYESTALDASVLLIPLVGFLPASDERIQGTVAAIERELMEEGLVLRYSESQGKSVDGLPPGEGVFLACSFWLANNYALMGRSADAHRLFERLLALQNDVGLLSEEYDPRAGRMLGNFPQAFSHVSLVNTARNLSHEDGPAVIRAS